MIWALLIGRKNSKGFPKKNTKKILAADKEYLCEYSLSAAKTSKFVERIYVSTDCPIIKNVSKNKYKAILLHRPKKLVTDKALGEDVFKNGYNQIKDQLKKENKKISILILLFANVATIDFKLIDKGIKILKKNKQFDSALSTSVYNMWSPIRARSLKNGYLVPFVPFKYMGGTKINCDRDSQGEVHYADMSVSIVRPKCLENLDKGLLPQKWMGKKIASIRNEAGFDIDFKWQLPQLKYWIKKYGSN